MPIPFTLHMRGVRRFCTSASKYFYAAKEAMSSNIGLKTGLGVAVASRLLSYLPNSTKKNVFPQIEWQDEACKVRYGYETAKEFPSLPLHLGEFCMAIKLILRPCLCAVRENSRRNRMIHIPANLVRSSIVPPSSGLCEVPTHMIIWKLNFCNCVCELVSNEGAAQFRLQGCGVCADIADCSCSANAAPVSCASHAHIPFKGIIRCNTGAGIDGGEERCKCGWLANASGFHFALNRNLVVAFL